MQAGRASFSSTDIMLLGLSTPLCSHVHAAAHPCLPGLQKLHLADTSRLPPALATATHLRRLSIDRQDGQPTPSSSFHLAAADVDAILCPMPALTKLQLPWLQCMAPSTLVHLLRALPHLTALPSWQS